MAALLLLLLLSGPGAPSARQALERMYRHYDGLRSYQGTITTWIAGSRGVQRTVITIQAESDARGALARSRVEISSGDRGVAPNMVRIDDGRALWTYVPTEQAYSRNVRRPDRLSALFRPLLSSIERFAPDLSARRGSLDGMTVLHLSGKGRLGGSVNLYLDPRTCALKSGDAKNPGGGTLALVVSHELDNAAIPAGRFHFTIPKGAKPLPDARPGGVYGR